MRANLLGKITGKILTSKSESDKNFFAFAILLYGLFGGSHVRRLPSFIESVIGSVLCRVWGAA